MGNSIKKGINIWSFDQNLSIETCMRMAKDAGFEGIEMALAAKGPLSMESTDEEIIAIRETYVSRELYEANPRIRRVVDALDGLFEDEDGRLKELKTALLDGAHWHRPDHYFLLLDFESYMEAKERAIRATADKVAFAKKCLYNIAGAGKFSSDRTIQEYADEVWFI